MTKRLEFVPAITGRSTKRRTLTGTLERDRLGDAAYVKVGGRFVRHWIWDELLKIPRGRTVRIVLEVLDEDS